MGDLTIFSLSLSPSHRGSSVALRKQVPGLTDELAWVSGTSAMQPFSVAVSEELLITATAELSDLLLLCYWLPASRKANSQVLPHRGMGGDSDGVISNRVNVFRVHFGLLVTTTRQYGQGSGLLSIGLQTTLLQVLVQRVQLA